MAARKKTAKKSSKPRQSRAGSKTAFILSHPLGSAAKAVVEAGKAAGHIFSDKYVHTVRANAKRTGKAAEKSAAPGVVGRAERALEKLAKKRVGGVVAAARTRTPATASAPGISGSKESQLAALIVELGTHRAEAILQRVKDVLSKLSFS